ncbi:MAG: DUF4367 domain-containing protein [Oscillospiraceae bacterium]|nr:DUF4367 domain-containing protein [Oscillospiraceae bacterium]
MLTNSKNTYDKIFDLILAEALWEDCEREIALFERKEATEVEYTFSEKFEKNVKLAGKQLKRKQNIIKLRKAAPKFAASAAAVIVCVALAFNPTVSAFFKDIITKITGGYNQYEFIDDVDITSENFNHELRPEYLPEGYRITNVYYGLDFIIIDYTDNDDRIITLEYISANHGEIGVDNENSETYTVLVNGKEAIFHESNADDRPNYLIWENSGYAFVLFAQIESNELVQTAESIKIS